MLRQLGIIVASLVTLGLGSCKATATYTDGDESVSLEVDVDPRRKPADDDATSLGRGTVVLDETGEEFEGEFFDTDNDGAPDKFKPDKGQGSNNAKGETNGSDWHDITPQ